MLRLHVTGKLIKDPKLNDPADGKKQCCQFVIAVSEYKGTNPDNTPRYESTYVNCVAFDRMATAIGKCVKGDTLEVLGTVSAEAYESKEGKPAASLKCIVRDWEKVATSHSTTAEKDTSSKTETAAAADDNEENIFE